jgi:hypothetical protein
MGMAKLREFVETRVLREHGSTTAIVRKNYGTGTNGNGVGNKNPRKKPNKKYQKPN